MHPVDCELPATAVATRSRCLQHASLAECIHSQEKIAVSRAKDASLSAEAATFSVTLGGREPGREMILAFGADPFWSREMYDWRIQTVSTAIRDVTACEEGSGDPPSSRPARGAHASGSEYASLACPAPPDDIPGRMPTPSSSSTVSSRPLLLEIGVEELPSSFVDAALAALPELVRTKLAELRLAHGDVQRARHAAPARASSSRTSPSAQPDLDEEVTGPPVKAAFKDGEPTKAAEAFAAKLGVAVDALCVVDEPAGKQKAGRYLVGRRARSGRDARELLGKALAEIARGDPVPQVDALGRGRRDVRAAGPVDRRAARRRRRSTSRSRACAAARDVARPSLPRAGAVRRSTSADAYVDALREAHVLVDRDERASDDDGARRRRGARRGRRARSGRVPRATRTPRSSRSRTSSPARSSEEFLALPARGDPRGRARAPEVLLRPKPAGRDELLPRYLAVVNTAHDPANIAKGNDRVMRARLADARFFYEEDKKAHARGPRREARRHRLPQPPRHGAREGRAHRAARARASRACSMLAEPTLVAARRARAPLQVRSRLADGRRVPRAPGRDGPRVRAARRASPRGRERDPRPLPPDGRRRTPSPTTTSRRVVALADRLDTLVGCFAVGLSPTGAADPYRAAPRVHRVLRTLLEQREPSRVREARALGELSALGVRRLFAGKKLDLSATTTVAKVEDFASERLRGLLASETSAAIADAVLGGHNQVGGSTRHADDVPRLHDAQGEGARRGGRREAALAREGADVGLRDADDALVLVTGRSAAKGAWIPHRFRPGSLRAARRGATRPRRDRRRAPRPARRRGRSARGRRRRRSGSRAAPDPGRGAGTVGSSFATWS